MGYNGNTALTWTDARIIKLKQLWKAGLTAELIANEIGNVTRNAVIGKAHRLNLTKRTHNPAEPRVINKPPAHKDRLQKPKAPKLVLIHTSNLPAVVHRRETQRAAITRVKFLGRPVEFYPPGDKLSPFPSEDFTPGGATLADIRAIQSLYV